MLMKIARNKFSLVVGVERYVFMLRQLFFRSRFVELCEFAAIPRFALVQASGYGPPHATVVCVKRGFESDFSTLIIVQRG